MRKCPFIDNHICDTQCDSTRGNCFTLVYNDPQIAHQLEISLKIIDATLQKISDKRHGSSHSDSGDKDKSHPNGK